MMYNETGLSKHLVGQPNCTDLQLGHRSYMISYENRRPSYERESNVNFDLAIFRRVTVYSVCWATDDYVCQCKFVLWN